jgi:hypothetical protein
MFDLITAMLLFERFDNDTICSTEQDVYNEVLKSPSCLSISLCVNASTAFE